MVLKLLKSSKLVWHCVPSHSMVSPRLAVEAESWATYSTREESCRAIRLHTATKVIIVGMRILLEEPC